MFEETKLSVTDVISMHHLSLPRMGIEIHLNGSEEQSGSGKVELDNGVHLDDGMLCAFELHPDVNKNRERML